MRHPCRAAIRSSPADVQADAVAGNVNERAVNARDDPFNEFHKVGYGPISEGKMPFERQVWCIDLQQIAVLVRCFIFDAERVGEGIEIGVLIRVELVLHRRGDDTRGRRRHECVFEISADFV